MIVNMMIESSERSLDPSNIFQGDVEEIFKKLNQTIAVLQKVQDSFEYVRDNLSICYKEPQEGEEPVVQKPWAFHRRNVFQRLIEFVERLKVIRNILGTHLEFSKLEKVEIGGIKGRQLSQKCEHIFEEFNKLYNVFNNIQYDVLDLTDTSIIKDYDAFNEKCEDLDRRLAAIFAQAFDDCYNLESIFKMINVIGNLIHRPAINSEVTVKFPVIIEFFNHELDTVKKLYDEGKKYGVPLHKNYPPVSGTLLWIQTMKNRIGLPIEDFKLLEHDIVKSEDALHAFDKVDQMMSILDNEYVQVFKKWCEYVPGQIEKSMSKLELVKIAKDLIALNLDKELVAILREVRYMKLLEVENVPAEALELFEASEALVHTVQEFNRIVDWYNYLRLNTNVYEANLIKHDMEEVDELLKLVTQERTWYQNDPTIVHNIYEQVEQLHHRVKQAQTNISKSLSSIQAWVEQPLYERKDNKKENLLSLDDRAERLQKRVDLITACNEELKSRIKENYELFFQEPMEEEQPPPEEEEEPPPPPEPEPDKKGKKGKGKDKKEKKEKPPKKTESQIEREEEEARLQAELEEKKQAKLAMWKAYLLDIEGKVKDLLGKSTTISLRLILVETGDIPPVTPLFELLMELHDPDIVYVPSADLQDPNNFLTFMESLMEDMFCMAKYIDRIDPDGGDSFYELAKENRELQRMTDDISVRVANAMEKAMEFIKVFEDYVPLWSEDRQEYLRQFLLYGRQLTLEELMQLRDETQPAIKETPPTIPQFKEQIDTYEDLYKKVEKIQSEEIIMEWLRVDVKPLRQAILNIACKWGNLFKQHLYNHVIDSLNELENFIKEAIAAMQVPLTENDYDGLIKVMGYLWKVKERQIETDGMFDPLKQIMDLLKEYGVEFPEEIYVQLQEIPDRWNQCKKVSKISFVQLSVFLISESDFIAVISRLLGSLPL
nr:unnamed protein product [Callosobruchus analis]